MCSCRRGVNLDIQFGKLFLVQLPCVQTPLQGEWEQWREEGIMGGGWERRRGGSWLIVVMWSNSARLKLAPSLSFCVNLPQSASLLSRLECTLYHARMHKWALQKDWSTHTHIHTHNIPTPPLPPGGVKPKSLSLSTPSQCLFFLHLCHQAWFPLRVPCSLPP